jgi:hypothetical protein
MKYLVLTILYESETWDKKNIADKIQGGAEIIFLCIVRRSTRVDNIKHEIYVCSVNGIIWFQRQDCFQI